MKTTNLSNLKDSTVLLDGQEVLELVQLVARYVPQGVFMDNRETINGHAVSIISEMHKFIYANTSEDDIYRLYPDGENGGELFPFAELSK